MNHEPTIRFDLPGPGEIQVPASAPAADDWGERDSLSSYLADIRDLPTFTRAEEEQLARALEAATEEFRAAIARIPWTAREAVARWQKLLRSGRVTAKLSERIPNTLEGNARLSEEVDAALGKLERALARHPGPEGDAKLRSRAERRTAKLLGEVELSLPILAHCRGELLEYRLELQEIERELASLGSPRRRPRSDRGRARHRAQLRALRERRSALEEDLGLPEPEFLERCSEVERAYSRMSALKNHFVKHNLKLVITVAKDFRNLGIPFRDLIQEGNIGLVRAVEKFDYRRGFKFSTYAIWWIRQALIRSVQNHSRTIRLPSHLHDALRRYRQLRERLEHELGRLPSTAELAEAAGLSLPEAQQLEGVIRDPVSLDEPVPWLEDRRLEDLVADPGEDSPIERVDSARMVDATRQALAVLAPREQQIMRWRFGLEGENEHTLEQIGNKLGLSRERVRQLVSRALVELREARGSRSLAPFAEEADRN